MAENLRSLDGRYFGRDSDGFHRAFTGLKCPDFRVGASGSELPIFGSNAVQSMTVNTTATQIKPAGQVTFSSSLAKTYSMAGPVPGAGKVTLFNIGGTTLAQAIQLAAGTIQTTVGSSANVITFDNAGDVCELVNLTTALFGLLSKSTACTLSTA